MFIIDHPFISDFLLDTIERNKFEVVDTPGARELTPTHRLNWMEEQDATAKIKRMPATAVYSNSENGLSWIARHLEGEHITKQIPLFKDKYRFRAFIQSLFPDFFFKSVRLEDIPFLKLEDLPLPFVIKPSVGFFSIGVYIIRNEEDWIQAKRELQKEQDKSLFPDVVLDTSTFIIEEYIEGEEYAVDYYYNDKGKAVVLNLLHHRFSSGTDTSDRVYTTSKSIIHTFKDRVEDFLTTMGKEMHLTNFPAHAELRIDDQGKIVPIEINPLRFGGWCTTGDLLGVTIGFNSYECFYRSQQPDWDRIFEGKENQLFSLIVLNNNSGISTSEIEGFDYEKLAKDFECPALIRQFDIHRFPVFGFVFAETSPENIEELDRILVSDLRKYITTKPS
jgi:hypothetical protein